MTTSILTTRRPSATTRSISAIPSGSYAFLYEFDTADAGNQVLTLASSVTVDIAGNAYIQSTDTSGDEIVNDGAIDVTGSAGYLVINPNAFTNKGTIDVANGDTVYVEPTTFTNSGTIDVSGGASAIIEPTSFTNFPASALIGGIDEAQAGSTLQVYSVDTITTDDADIILSGAGSTIETYNPSTGAFSTIDTTLLTIGPSGELQLLASRNWTTAGAPITNDGIIQLGGGTLTATASGASLTDAAGSTLEGFGTVTATTFDNSGTIEVSGGTLTLTDGFSADAGSTISISSGDR